MKAFLKQPCSSNCWYNEFKRGRLSLKDTKTSGRPLTVVTEDNVLAVKRIQENRWIIYQKIQHLLQLDREAPTKFHTSVFVWVVSRWVVYNRTVYKSRPTWNQSNKRFHFKIIDRLKKRYSQFDCILYF